MQWQWVSIVVLLLYSRCMADLATFRKDDIENVHGTLYVVGIFTQKNNSMNPVEWHHTLGRGNKKDNENRKMHSSVLNATPLEHDNHAGGQRDKRWIRVFFLEEAFMKTMRAVGAGRYTLSDIDKQFISYAMKDYPEAFPPSVTHLIYD